ncbi:bifunctional glycosyltransferase/CDP-glycerol:glycerophosphate glycerophosphotransferase [Leucobacter chinensis]|uniref:bifunctional glycosyltransferase/CDP-glycerol:glycerophosphate glycerophosphotransferase n=1 Tax=Leucobacter chinensis TaxID=2851010 RepID=UPI001C2411F7|nr:bifunctional glycosyltransferase family 2 protein/CDP-glycerol:glycerophosphate glycerophosphotransferase [Leucobacter chinensis]
MAVSGNFLKKKLDSFLVNEEKTQLRRFLFDGLPLPLRRTVRRALQGESLFKGEPEKVSIIVPIYNVENYLAECLRSIVNQSYTNLEIILVNDGSTDNSRAIAERYAKKDRRIKLISQPNAGLGAARNTGLKHATGAFVVFSDSDDVVPPQAVQVMLETLTESGSDFVVGAYFRMTEVSDYLPPWLERLHENKRLGLTIHDYLDGLPNVFAWNKMFRKSFTDSIGFAFPEGIRYEDQYPLTRAYVLAERFDVIPDVVFKWRIRADRSSITQTKWQLEDVQDRRSVLTSVLEFLLELDDEELFNAWLAKVLSMDLTPYLTEAASAAEEYRAEVHAIVSMLKPYITAEAIKGIPVKTRLALLALENESEELLGKVLLANNQIGGHLPTQVFESGEVLFSPAYLEAFKTPVPRALLTLSPSELLVEHRVNQIVFTEDQLTFEAWAFVKHVDLSEPGHHLGRVFFRSSETQEELEFDVEMSRDFVSRSVGSKWPDYDPSAFSASVGIAALIEFVKKNGDSLLVAELTTPWGTEEVELSRYSEHSLRAPIREWVSPTGEVVSVSRNEDRVFALSFRESTRVLEKIQTQTGQLVIETARPRVGAEGGGKTHETFTFKAPRSKRTARLNNQKIQALEIDVPFGTLEDHAARLGEHLVYKGLHNKLFVQPKHGFVEVQHMELQGTQLRVNLQYAGEVADLEHITLKNKQHIFTVSKTSKSGATTDLFFDLTIDEFGHKRIAPYGEYVLDGLKGSKAEAVRYSFSAVKNLPVEMLGETYRVRFLTNRKGKVLVSLGFASNDEITGSLGQARLQRWHQEAHFEPIENSVFFQSYLGEQATDSALALHKELRKTFRDMKLYWGVIDETVQLPEGAIPVLRYSREWFEVISRAQYLVNNVYFFTWFRKREYQTYIQTWHGTPLKKIGRSYWEDQQRSEFWIRTMEEQAAGWDYLISPSRFASEKLVHEFRFKGQLLEVGYPRNDVLTLPDDQDTRAIRQRLGIPDGKRIVMYAPTWRDNKSARGWEAEIVTFLDLDKFSSELGDDVVILMRGHGHNARAGSKTDETETVIDVTYYPEINDLYRVADLVITDYSSVMFDYAVTKKPMVFFAPDLEQYGEGVRGFYLDYEDLIPGPLVEKAEDVAKTVQTMLLSSWQPDEKYERFYEQYCALNDGLASERTVQAVWGTAH